MELPDMELVKNLTADDIMDCDGQTEFRAVVESWLTKADLIFVLMSKL